MATRGQPVIMDGRTFYGGKGFTYDSRDKDHYSELLRQTSGLRPLSKKQIQRARRFAYEYFIERQIPFAEFISGEGAQVRVRSTDDLKPGRSKILDMICERILHGGEFLLNDQDRKKAAETVSTHGNKLFAKGDKDEAMQAFATALETDPLFTTAHDNLGTVYWEKRDINKSMEHFGKALSLSPYDRGVILNFGKILTAINRTEDAGRLYSFYLKKHPNDKKIGAMLRSL